MYAEILTIGDELTRGEIVDTNAAWLAARLWELDVTVRWKTTCRDDEADLRAAVLAAAARADLVICTGGLGPTEDDLTCDVVAAAAGVDVVVEEVARARLEAFMSARGPSTRPSGRRDSLGASGSSVSAISLRQARIPAGARVLANPAGLAPGFEIGVNRVPVVCLPGVPRELHAIWEVGLEARVDELRRGRGAAPRIARRIHRVFGRAESQLSEALRGLVDGVAGASIHYQVKFPEVLVKLVVRDPDAAAAAARLAALDAELFARVGRWSYGTGEDALPLVTGRALLTAGVQVATAESCTGGLVGALLTELAGASAYFRGGAITYSNDEKVRQLGVAPETLARDGAVSEATVIEMARGIRGRTGATLAVAISGVAGPGGGTADKPVGTVWLALDDAEASAPTTFRMQWPGARDQVRLLAAWWALDMLRRAALARTGATP